MLFESQFQLIQWNSNKSVESIHATLRVVFIPDFCKNGGFCYVEGTNLACKCTEMYDGDYCEDISACYNYCFNNGVCTLKPDADPTKPKTPDCQCGAEFGGPRCNIRQTTTVTTAETTTPGPTTTHPVCGFFKPDYCGTGSCVVNNNQASCQCPQTHTGPRCQTLIGGPPVPTAVPGQSSLPPIPGLSTQPPIPGLSTLPGSNQTPPPGVTCAAMPCKNNRPCYNTGNSYFCSCGGLFTGPNCETPAG